MAQPGGLALIGSSNREKKEQWPSSHQLCGSSGVSLRAANPGEGCQGFLSGQAESGEGNWQRKC